MAGTVWPVDAVTGAPSYTGRMLRDTGSAFSSAATAARPLGCTSGVRPGTSTVIATAPTNTTWQVTPFGGLIDVEASNIAGVYQYAFAANQTGTIGAQTGTARWDRLDVQLSDPAEGDGTSNPAINVVITQGTTTALPAAPPRSHPLCTIIVPATGGGSPTMVWTAPNSVGAGGVMPAASSTFYPASPYVGQYVDDAVLGLLRWNGTAWVYPAGALPGGSIVRTGTAGSFTAAAWTLLNSGPTIWTPDQPIAGITYATGTFTCVTAGWYDVDGGIQMDTAVNAWLAIKKNDLSASGTGSVATSTGVGTTGTTGVIARRRVRLAVGDTLVMAIFVSATAAWSNTNVAGSFFSIRYIEPLR